MNSFWSFLGNLNLLVLYLNTKLQFDLFSDFYQENGNQRKKFEWKWNQKDNTLK